MRSLSGQFVQASSVSTPKAGGGSARSSLMRLSDEAPTPVEATSGRSRHPSRSGSTGAFPRTASFSAMSRLSDDVSRPSSSSSKPSSRSGLERLPDEAASLSAPPAAERASSASAVARAERKGGLRERMRANLVVNTEDMGKPKEPRNRSVFRELLEGESINDFYEFADEVHSGGAKGKVIIATRKSDDTEVVIKIRSKKTNKGFERSWRTIMTQLSSLQGSQGSRHVLDINEILEDSQYFYVVMPKCDGGELFEFLVTETEVPEAECKRIIREILLAVGTLHNRGLVHRDVKPENIMFDMCAQTKTPKTVKLIDFDTCAEWTPASPKSGKFVGTPGYIAPEALLGEITPKSDLWSIGVILYILMTGETPWSALASLEDGTVGSPGAKRMYNSLKEETFEWDREPWPDFPMARDLCQRLIAFDTEDRPSSVQEVLEHPWLVTG